MRFPDEASIPCQACFADCCLCPVVMWVLGGRLMCYSL